MSSREKLRLILEEYKKKAAERMTAVEQSRADATLAVQRANEKEREASKAAASANALMSTYKKRREYVDAIHEGIAQSGNAMVTNIHANGKGMHSEVLHPDRNEYVTASSRLAPAKVAQASDNLKKAVMDVARIATKRDELETRVEELKEKSASLRISLVKAKKLNREVDIYVAQLSLGLVKRQLKQEVKRLDLQNSLYAKAADVEKCAHRVYQKLMAEQVILESKRDGAVAKARKVSMLADSLEAKLEMH
eukprot:Stramenopile-MAST_4_protein_6198